jgi:hypothetical protein
MNKAPIPRRGPVMGVFHVVPMSGPELKKLARKITVVSYVKDRGKTIFNKAGKAVPQFDIDEDAIIAAALARCPRIDDWSDPVWATDGSGKAVGWTPTLDPEAQAKDLPAGTLISEGARREALEMLVDVEREVDADEPSGDDEEPDDEPDEEPEASGDTPTAEAEPTPPPKKKVKVTMMHAEWVLGESAELGQARAVEEVKNS